MLLCYRDLLLERLPRSSVFVGEGVFSSLCGAFASLDFVLLWLVLAIPGP